MDAKKDTFHEDAKRYKWKIYGIIATIGFLLSLCLRGSSIAQGLIVAVFGFLLTGRRYEWFFIFWKTWYRDCIALRGLLKIITRLGIWEVRNYNVVRAFTDNVRKHPDKVAFRIEDRAVTFKQGEELSNRIAWFFKKQGFKKGDAIAVFMESKPELVFIWLGLNKVGVVGALINNNLRSDSLTYCITVAKCKGVIFGDELVEAIKEIKSDEKFSSLPFYQFNMDDTPLLDQTVLLSEEIQSMSTELPLEDMKATGMKDKMLYIYTSGTTGFPKAAIITNVKYLLISVGVHFLFSLKEDDIIYDPLPLYHTAGGVLGVGQTLINGNTVVLRKKFSASNYWSDCIKHNCTVAQYIGEICRYLLATPESDAEKKHNVRIVIGNGLRPQIWNDFVQRFNIQHVGEFYGATEGNSNLGVLLGKINQKKSFSTFSGYADKTESEKKILRNVLRDGDSYFNTGDIMVMDHYGYFYFKDRTGDTFRWRGENVSTIEVEEAINKIIGLNETIVYGVAIPNTEGKAGMAAIVDPDSQVDLKKLADGLKKSLPSYARPILLRILPQAPMTSTFKLIKKDLVEEGFDINKISDRMFFFDEKKGEYVPLDKELYEDIIRSKIRL